MTSVRPAAAALLLGAHFVASSGRAQPGLGDLTGVTDGGRSIQLHTAGPGIRLTFMTPAVLRVDLLPTASSVPDSSFAVVRDTTGPVTTTLAITDSVVRFSSGELTAVCRTTPLRLSFSSAGRTVLEEAPEGGFGIDGAMRVARFVANPEDHFYGTGERGIGLDLRGRAFDLYNTQHFGYGDPPPTMNINVPFVAGSRGAALFFDSPWPGRMDLGSYNPSRFSYRAEGGELTLYLIAAPTVPGQLEAYTWLTGRQPIPPLWAFGYLQSKYGYRTESEARSIVGTMRQRRIPCDALILDLYWYGNMGDLSWDRGAWPEPFQMMADFLTEGIHTVAITQTYLTTGSAHFPEGSALGYLARNASGTTYLLNNWWYRNSTAGLLDVTSPSARSWWWSKHPAFFGSGLAGIWTDLGEPERHPDDMVHALGPARKVHNIYNHLWAKTIAEGFAALRPGKRLFNLTRSGFAGSQRYGVVTWSGDVARSFNGLAGQVPILLSMGLSGMAYHNSDIGGFTGPPTSPELYVRWLQFGAFCPVTRAHGADHPTEPWAFGQQAEEIARSFLELRYRLIPYLYTAAAENYRTGMPIVRPLFFEDPSRPQDASSYLFGNAFLVSPVTRSGQLSATVVLPEGDWIDFWTDRQFRGGTAVTVATPLETIPLFVRAGSIVPMRPSRRSTSDQPADTLLLAVYPAPGRDALFRLYEDDGATLAYQSGASATTEFSERYDATGGMMRIALGAMSGTYAGRPAVRDYTIDIHRIRSSPSAVRKGDTPLPRVFTREALAGAESYFYDSARAVTAIHVTAGTDSTALLTLEQVTLTGVEAADAAPAEFRLEQNFPNPFNPNTVLRFSVQREQRVRLGVYDLLGREVAVLVNEVKSPGRYDVPFDAAGLASGVYLSRLTAGAFVATRKMILIR